jgi:hypothetical protein
VAGGVAVTEHPDPGEVVWCDDTGVTCWRWNWRQAKKPDMLIHPWDAMPGPAGSDLPPGASWVDLGPL